jgi:hypothetical protein
MGTLKLRLISTGICKKSRKQYLSQSEMEKINRKVELLR